MHATGSPVETLGVLVVLGVLLCLLYWRTGSLLPCIALHALNNGISFVVTTDVPVAARSRSCSPRRPAAVAVGALVMRRVRALPGLPQTPR